MKECPYCYAAVGPQDSVCPKCGREIEKWQTGFYTRQPLPTKKKTAVRIALVVAVLVVVGGLARACHFI